MGHGEKLPQDKMHRFLGLFLFGGGTFLVYRRQTLSGNWLYFGYIVFFWTGDIVLKGKKDLDFCASCHKRTTRVWKYITS